MIMIQFSYFIRLPVIRYSLCTPNIGLLSFLWPELCPPCSLLAPMATLYNAHNLPQPQAAPQSAMYWARSNAMVYNIGCLQSSFSDVFIFGVMIMIQFSYFIRLPVIRYSLCTPNIGLLSFLWPELCPPCSLLAPMATLYNAHNLPQPQAAPQSAMHWARSNAMVYNIGA